MKARSPGSSARGRTHGPPVGRWSAAVPLCVVPLCVVLVCACGSSTHPGTSPTTQNGSAATAPASVTTSGTSAATAPPSSSTSPPSTAASTTGGGLCIVGDWTTTSYSQQATGVTMSGGA